MAQLLVVRRSSISRVMKHRLLLGIFGFIALVAFAADKIYDAKHPPSLPLPVAYERAMLALGSETNQWHCVSASLTTMFCPDGGWQIGFCSTNSDRPRSVIVPFTGTPIVEDLVLR